MKQNLFARLGASAAVFSAVMFGGDRVFGQFIDQTPTPWGMNGPQMGAIDWDAPNYRENVKASADKVKAGKESELGAKDFVYLYATYSPDELLEIAREQHKTYEQDGNLMLQQIWALQSVLKVVAYNSGLAGRGSEIISFDKYKEQQSVTVNKRNPVERALAQNLQTAELVRAFYHPPAKEGVNNLKELVDDLTSALNEGDKVAIDNSQAKLAKALQLKESQLQAKPLDVLEMGKKQQANNAPRLENNLSLNEFGERYIAGEISYNIARVANGNSYSDEVYASDKARKDKATYEQNKKEAAEHRAKIERDFATTHPLLNPYAPIERSPR